MIIGRPLHSLRWHPLLLTQDEARDYPDRFFTDHIAYKMVSPSGFGGISCNVLNGFSTSGMHPDNTEENEDKQDARYFRLLEGLFSAAEKHDKGVVALQEASSLNKMVYKKQLSWGNWEFKRGEKRILFFDHEPRPTEIDDRTIGIYIDKGKMTDTEKVTAYWRGGDNQILSKSFSENEVHDITERLKEKSRLNQEILDRQLIDDIRKIYNIKFEKLILENGWEAISLGAQGIITCYDRDKYECKKEFCDFQNRVHTLVLIEKKTGQIHCFHNFWGKYSPFSSVIEKIMEAALNRTREEYPFASHLILGDTNSEYALVGEKFDDFANLATTIIPPHFNNVNEIPKDKHDLQYPDSPDFGLYIDDEGEICQCGPQPFDLETGEIVRDIRTQQEMLAIFENHGEFIQRYRMVNCSDRFYKTARLILGKTIFEYEDELRLRLNLKKDDIFDVRIASTIFNQKAIGIRFNPKHNHFEALLTYWLGNEPGFQSRYIRSSANDSGEGYYCIFVPLDQAYKLDLALGYAVNADFDIPELNKYIAKLDNKYNELVANHNLDLAEKEKNRQLRHFITKNLLDKMQKGMEINLTDLPNNVDDELRIILVNYAKGRKSAENTVQTRKPETIMTVVQKQDAKGKERDTRDTISKMRVFGAHRQAGESYRGNPEVRASSQWMPVEKSRREYGPAQYILKKLVVSISKNYGSKTSHDVLFGPTHSRYYSVIRLTKLLDKFNEDDHFDMTLSQLRELLDAEYCGIFNNSSDIKSSLGDEIKLAIEQINKMHPVDAASPPEAMRAPITHLAKNLLHYVSSRETSLKYKISDKAKLNTKIELAGELAHQLLLCKTSVDYYHFLDKIEEIIKGMNPHRYRDIYLNDKQPKSISNKTAVYLWRADGKLIASWNKDNKIHTKSFNENTVTDIVGKLPQKNEKIEDHDLVEAIILKYGLTHQKDLKEDDKYDPKSVLCGHLVEIKDCLYQQLPLSKDVSFAESAEIKHDQLDAILGIVGDYKNHLVKLKMEYLATDNDAWLTQFFALLFQSAQSAQPYEYIKINIDPDFYNQNLLNGVNRVLMSNDFDEYDNAGDKNTIYLRQDHHGLTAFKFDQAENKFLPHPIQSESNSKILLDSMHQLKNGMASTSGYFSKVVSACGFPPNGGKITNALAYFCEQCPMPLTFNIVVGGEKLIQQRTLAYGAKDNKEIVTKYEGRLLQLHNARVPARTSITLRSNIIS